MSGSFCDRLRDASMPVWRVLPGHPFVHELAAGTLPAEKFRFYLEQNLLYLPEYARAIAIGVARTRDTAELRSLAAALANIVETEIPENCELLERVIAAGARDRGGTTAVAPATLAYTSYLLASAFRGGPLDIMTAIMPCAWSYGEIARGLRAVDAGHPIYSDWIGLFASDTYAELVERMKADINALAARGAADESRLADTFRNGVRLELGFWRMAYELEQWPDAALDQHELAT